jgi:hypothetical protein
MLGPDGQLHGEGRAASGLADETDASAELFDVAPNDPKPETEPAVVAHRNRALEPVEDPDLVGGCNSDPFVAHDEPSNVAALLGGDLDGLACRESPTRVRDPAP